VPTNCAPTNTIQKIAAIKIAIETKAKALTFHKQHQFLHEDIYGEGFSKEYSIQHCCSIKIGQHLTMILKELFCISSRHQQQAAGIMESCYILDRKIGKHFFAIFV
jgi:hypothetical protein